MAMFFFIKNELIKYQSKKYNKTYVLLVKLKYHIYCKRKNSSVFIYLPN